MGIKDRMQEGIFSYVERNPGQIILGAIGLGGAAAYLGATLAVNALFYTAQAGIEGIERACGVTPTNIVAKLERKEFAQTPNGGQVSYGTFRTEDGKELTLLDYPVVTEGKFLPGTLRGMETNKTYNVRIFGPKISQSMVEAKEIN